MKEIRLTKGYVALVDDEDFERVNQFKWSVVARKKSKKNESLSLYAYRRARKAEKTKRKQIKLHRFILGIRSCMCI